MSGTPLNPARLAGLMATVAKSFPIELLTDEVCQSWEDNGAELARRLKFLSEMAPVRKPIKKKAEPSEPLVNLAEFFVSTDKFYVDPDFIARVDLSPCVPDLRELKVVYTLPRNQNDSTIATEVGGKATLRLRKTTPYQLMTECKLALSGGRSIFGKGGYYLLYVEGTDGDLCPVGVGWFGDQLRLTCYRFDGCGKWGRGGQVCGN